MAVAKPIPRVESLAEAGARQRAMVTVAPLIGLFLAVVEVAIFDWRPADMIVGTLTGTAVFGALSYFLDTAHFVPRGTLQDAPPGVEVQRRQVDLSSFLVLPLLVPLCLLAAWLIDAADAGAFVVPGQAFGYALAALAALVQIRRWERMNGRRTLFDPEAENTRPLAGPPL